MIQTTHDVIRGSTAAVCHGHRPVNALPTAPVAERTMSHQTTPLASALTHAGLRDRLVCALLLSTLGR
jgi:hypothetical protein